MPPHRVGLLHRFGVKTGIHFIYLCLESPQSGMVFEGTTGLYERILSTSFPGSSPTRPQYGFEEF